MRSIVVSALLFAAACSPTDSGSGTGTIAATVEIKGTSIATTIEAQLSKAGVPLRNANVFVRESDSEMSATLDGLAGGLYRTTMMGWARTIELAVTAGPDNLEAVLEGPAPHRITRPPNDARVRRTGFSVLEVEWDADEAAERVEVTVGRTTLTLDGDVVRAEIPLAPLENGEHILSITREMSVELAGGTAGSRMRSRYEVDNRFTLEE